VFNLRITKFLVQKGLLICTLFGLLNLIGCGQTGPLYLPTDCPPEITNCPSKVIDCPPEVAEAERVCEERVCEKCPKF